MSISEDPSLQLKACFRFLEDNEKVAKKNGDESAVLLFSAFKNCALIPALLLEDVDSIRLYDPKVQQKLNEVESCMGRILNRSRSATYSMYCEVYKLLGQILSSLADTAIFDNDAALALSVQRALRVYGRPESIYFKSGD